VAIAAPLVATHSAGASVAVVVLRGELDAYNAPDVRSELTAALETGSNLVLDLREASFLDSVVGGEILEARKAAKRRGLGFALVLSDSRANHVRRMLEQTNLIEIFDVFDMPEDAAAAFARP
jgi:anti-sigma B factor antagonist